MNFKYNPQNPVGERVLLSSVKIDRAPLKPNKKYSVTVNEGLLGILTSSAELKLKTYRYFGAGIYRFEGLHKKTKIIILFTRRQSN
ncbi:MAG: hypothetical protein IPL53_17180 [Ignavibacteria bacterium]|nr:hypothetical protein [Ignavibacteria bacterium]